MIVALAGGVAAALSPLYDRFLYAAGACAIALVAAPDVRRARPRPRPDQRGSRSPSISRTSPRRRSGSAGSRRSIFVLPHATADAAERSRVVRRFSTAALASVGVLALSGLGRALTELHSVSQVWSTSYGRALIVKTALFLPLLGLGWLNRTLLLDAFARLRRSAMLEVTLLARDRRSPSRC